MKKLLVLLLMAMVTNVVAETYTIKAGSTDQSVEIFIMDATAGTPETAVAHDTAGIDLWYRRTGEVAIDITEASLAALTTAHTDGGIEPIGDGLYRLDLPDDAVDTTGSSVCCTFGGTITDMIVVGGKIDLVSYDPYDTVRLGLTALPNAAADAAGGLPVSDAGDLDLDAMNTNINDIETDTGTTLDGRIPATLVSGRMSSDVVAVSGDTTAANNMKLDYDGTGYAGGSINRNVDVAEWTLAPHSVATQFSDAITNASIEAEAVDALESFQLDHLLGVTTEVAADGDMSAIVVDGSVMAHIMSTGAAVATAYNATTDSLEAIANSPGGDATEAKQDSIIDAVITNAAGTDIAADIIALIEEYMRKMNLKN